MNKHKFCFIICANKERFLEECLWYIDQLSVPEGYECERMVIRDAKSMAGGYNQAMTKSDAKYKIYLHQDVFILNRNMLQDLLDIFKDPVIGMVGAVGTCDFSAGADYTLKWDVGGAEVSVGTNSRYLIGEKEMGRTENLADVVCIDGVLMATQYDLPWEEETFDGWDFYDISQSVNFLQAGFRVVVPWIRTKEEIWVYHDKGRSAYDAWERYRKVFCDQYRSLGYEYSDIGILKVNEELNDQRQQIFKVFQAGNFDLTNELLNRLGEDNLDLRLCYVALFLSIRGEEIITIGRSSYSEAVELDAFIEVFDEIKFMCRRMYYGNTPAVKEDAWQKIKERLDQGRITMKMIWATAFVCVGEPNRLWGEVVARYEGEVRALVRQGDILGAEHLLLQLDQDKRGKFGNILLILIRILRRELEKNVSPTVFDVSPDPDELAEHFIQMKLYLRRLEFGLPEWTWMEFYEYCKRTCVSDYMILYLLQNNIFYKEECCRNLSVLFAKMEGADSMRARLYAGLSEK